MCGRRVSSLAHWVASELAAKKSTIAAKIHCAILKRLRRASAKNLFVYLCVAARGGLRREGRECVETSCPAQLTSATVAREQIVESCGERCSVAGFYQQSRFLVLYHVAESAGVEGDNRSLAKE